MQQNQPGKVSIVLPTYNRAEYIMDAIKSVRQQTYPNWELLVIDDQSTDDTVKLITALKDERINLLKTTQRCGITKTRNEGLIKTQGEFVAFIDSDDLWAATKLEKQVAALQQYPGAGFCLTGGYNFRKLNEPVEFFYKQKDGILYGNFFISFFKSEIAVATPSFMFRKEYLDSVGLFNEAKPFADIDFFLRLAKQVNGVILYEPLFFRRLHDANVSSLEWEKGSREGLELLRSYKKILPPGITRNAFFKQHINFGEKYLNINNHVRPLLIL